MFHVVAGEGAVEECADAILVAVRALNSTMPVWAPGIASSIQRLPGPIGWSVATRRPIFSVQNFRADVLVGDGDADEFQLSSA